MRFPAARPRLQSSAPWKEGSAPKTRVPVPWQLSAVPESMPPPPQGVMMASRPFLCAGPAAPLSSPAAVEADAKVHFGCVRAPGVFDLEEEAIICATWSWNSSPSVPWPKMISGWSYGGMNTAPVFGIHSATTASRSTDVLPLKMTRAP